jgi:general secretion pathway protein K
MSGAVRQQGIALIIVLWGVTLLSLLAAGLAQSSGLAARRLLHGVEAAQARARLNEALAASILALSQPDPKLRWRTDGQRHRLTLPGAVAWVSASAERGRIDLNHAAPPLLQGLFRWAAGDAAAGDRLAAALLAQGADQGGRALLSVVELAALPGMTPGVFDQLSQAATVHNPGGGLSWRLAGAPALAAIPGLAPAQRATLLAMRGQSQYTPDPALAALLAKAGVDDGGEVATPSPGAAIITLQIVVTVENGATASAETVLQLTTDAPGQILEWRSPSPLAEPS